VGGGAGEDTSEGTDALDTVHQILATTHWDDWDNEQGEVGHCEVRGFSFTPTTNDMQMVHILQLVSARTSVFFFDVALPNPDDKVATMSWQRALSPGLGIVSRAKRWK